MRSHRSLTPFFVVAASLVGAATAAGAEPPVGVQVVGLAIVVALVGLPHGALDPLIAHDAGLVTGVAAFGRYLAAYVVLAGLTAGAWMAVPALALPVFFVVSALHFGGDWPGLSGPARAAAGSAVVLSPLAFNADEAASLLEPLADPVTADRMVAVGGVAGPLAAITVITIALAAGRRAVALELGAVVVLAAVAPPLIAFGTYFCALHSPRHIGVVLARSDLDRRMAVGVAAGFTAATIVLAGLAWPVLQANTSFDDAAVRLVIVGLAALTVPHMATIDLARRHAPSASAEPESPAPHRAAASPGPDSV